MCCGMLRGGREMLQHKLQRSTQWRLARDPTCSKGWGDSWIETMWVILFRLSCSRSLASKG